MWQTIKYVVRTNGYGPATGSLFLFGGASLLALLDANAGGFGGFVKYLAISSALLSSVFIPSACKLEDLTTIELYNTMPYPFGWIVLQHVVVNSLTIILIAVVITIATLAARSIDQFPVLASLGIVNVVSLTLLFGGLSLWGTVLGRDSRAGQLLGLLIFIVLLAIPLPHFVPSAIYFYKVEDGLNSPGIWWMARVCYGVLGFVAYVSSLRLVRDVDRLMTGERSRLNRPLLARERFDIWKRWEIRTSLSGTLPVPQSRLLGLVAYEALLAMLDGVIPVLVIGMGAIFIWVLPLFEISHWGLKGVLFSTVGAYGSLTYFLQPLLPIVLAGRIPHDRRAVIDQLLLAAVSPRKYLIGKAAGACVAVLGAFLLVNVPTLLIVVTAALLGSPHYLLCYLGVVGLGILPALIYVTALSVLVGGLAGARRPLFLGVMATVGYIVLIVVTQNSVPGNILFPTGLIVTKAFKVRLEQHIGVMVSSGRTTWEAMHMFYYFLPSLSAALQIALTWVVVGKVFEREVIRA